MARINIEDKLFRDMRWFKLIELCGGTLNALGMLCSAWILAQQNWLKYGSIPAKSWPKELENLIKVELATRREDGSVYIKGSKRSFAWLTVRSDGGGKITDRKLKSLAKAREAKKAIHEMHKKEALPSIQTLNKVYSESIQTLNSSIALTPSHTLTLSQDNTNTNTLLPKTTKTKRNGNAKKDASFAQSGLRDSDFENIYSLYPKKLGKGAGMRKAKAEIKSAAELHQLQSAIEAYRSHIARNQVEPKFIKYFSTFMNNWREWLDPETGKVEKIKAERDYSHLEGV